MSRSGEKRPHQGHKHGETLSAIDIYAYHSAIGHWNASFKAGFAMTLLFLCILLDDLYVSLLTIGVCGFITVHLGGLPLTAYLRLLRVPIAFLVMGSFVIALETADPGGGIRLLDLYFFELYKENWAAS